MTPVKDSIGSGYFIIKPLKNSMYTVMRIVSLLRKDAIIKTQSMITTEVNGCNDWYVIVSFNDLDTRMEIHSFILECYEEGVLVMECRETDNYWLRF